MAQAQNSVVITNMAATGYNADVTCNEAGFVITGTIACDPNKILTSFNGEVQKDNALVCRFNSYQYGGPSGQGLSYNLSDIRDITLASQAILAIGAAAVEIQNEVTPPNE